jgi:hypothetical protein
MARRDTQPTTIDRDAHARLKTLQTALGSQNLTRRVDLTDIVSALILYTPPPQLAGMLLEYERYNERRTQAQEAGQPIPDRYPANVWPR